MPLPTFKQDPQPQSGHLLNIVKGIGQLLGKDKLRENPNAPASDWRTKQPINSDPSYKEDWWDTIYGNRGQAANKQIQMDALGRNRDLADDAEVRTRDIEGIVRRNDANNYNQLENISAERMAEEQGLMGGSTARKNVINQVQQTAREIGARTQAYNQQQDIEKQRIAQSTDLQNTLTGKNVADVNNLRSTALGTATKMEAPSILDSELMSLKNENLGRRNALSQTEALGTPEAQAAQFNSIMDRFKSTAVQNQATESNAASDAMRAQAAADSVRMQGERPDYQTLRPGETMFDKDGNGFRIDPTTGKAVQYSTKRKPLAAVPPGLLNPQGARGAAPLQSAQGIVPFSLQRALGELPSSTAQPPSYVFEVPYNSQMSTQGMGGWKSTATRSK